MDVENLDGVLARMGELLDRLAALPEDALEERQEISEEQERLRGHAAQIRESAPVDRRSLTAELGALVERWDALQDQRIDVVMQSGGGSHGGDAFSGVYAMKLNKQIDIAQGRAQIEARIKEIRRLLGDAPDQ